MLEEFQTLKSKIQETILIFKLCSLRYSVIRTENRVIHTFLKCINLSVEKVQRIFLLKIFIKFDYSKETENSINVVNGEIGMCFLIKRETYIDLY